GYVHRRRSNLNVDNLWNRILNFLGIHAFERSPSRKTVTDKLRLLERFLNAVLPGIKFVSDVRRHSIRPSGFSRHLDELFEFFFKGSDRRLIFLRFSDELPFVVCDWDVVEMDLPRNARHGGVLRDSDFVKRGNHAAAAVRVEPIQS